MKNKEIENNLRKKFEKKQENISRFYLVQKELKENEIQKRREQREEKGRKIQDRQFQWGNAAVQRCCGHRDRRELPRGRNRHGRGRRDRHGQS